MAGDLGESKLIEVIPTAVDMIGAFRRKVCQVFGCIPASPS